MCSTSYYNVLLQYRLLQHPTTTSPTTTSYYNISYYNILLQHLLLQYRLHVLHYRLLQCPSSYYMYSILLQHCCYNVANDAYYNILLQYPTTTLQRLPSLLQYIA